MRRTTGPGRRRRATGSTVATRWRQTLGATMDRRGDGGTLRPSPRRRGAPGLAPRRGATLRPASQQQVTLSAVPRRREMIGTVPRQQGRFGTAQRKQGKLRTAPRRRGALSLAPRRRCGDGGHSTLGPLSRLRQTLGLEPRQREILFRRLRQRETPGPATLRQRKLGLTPRDGSALHRATATGGTRSGTGAGAAATGGIPVGVAATRRARRSDAGF